MFHFDHRKKPEDFWLKNRWKSWILVKGDEISFKLGNFLLDSLYKNCIEKKPTKFIEILKIRKIYYRISYTKNQDFANLMKIIIKCDIPALKLTFCQDCFYQKSSGFSYELENWETFKNAIGNILNPLQNIPLKKLGFFSNGSSDPPGSRKWVGEWSEKYGFW